MRIYLAARYSRRQELREYSAALKTLGHIPTSGWIDGDDEEHGSPIATRKMWASRDLHDIVHSDCVVAFTEEQGSRHRGGGRFVELGYALALGKTVVVVGPCENIFVALCQRFDDWPAALEYWAKQKAPAHR